MKNQTGRETFGLELGGEEYSDRVYGCWQGKNAGGTLGTPLETGWGQEDPFDVWWYPELQEGGLPNDDLEMQLVWLKALEEVGPEITARDLSRYWLDHIGYNFDEYGLSKRNLRLGLEPPVSGSHNNWFIDCMGSPIRSEIWACVAPGMPRIAARYAYQDAICDHAGGEGVFGELFNVALESAAFVVQDRALLIDIALSYVPDDCMVRKAVEAARDAHAAGADWKEARRAVLRATPHYNAQYAPINTGFQVVGLLYGKDFGEGICITVNCGYDTDSSGAAIGSYLGIISGSKGLPEKWVDPLGTSIATNEYWGGVKNLAAGDNPVPTDLDSLLERIRAAARRVLIHHGKLGADRLEVSIEELFADDGIRELHTRSVNVVPFPGPDLDVDVDYRDGPVVLPGCAKALATAVTNHRLESVDVTVGLLVPHGWNAPVAEQLATVAPGECVNFEWTVLPSEAASRVSTVYAYVVVGGRPVPQPVPIVLLGAIALRTSEVFGDEASLITDQFGPEIDLLEDPLHRSGEWTERFAEGHEQPVSAALHRPGAVYLQTFVESPDDREVFVVFDPSCPARYWVNGNPVGGNDEYRLIRPNQHSAEGIGAYVTLRKGLNEVLVKLLHDGKHPAPELHLGFSGQRPLNDHQFDLDRTVRPWTVAHV